MDEADTSKEDTTERQMEELREAIDNSRSYDTRGGTRAGSPIFKSKQLKSDFKITLQDVPEATYESLDVVYHTPVFELPIPTNLAYQKYSVSQRASMLSNYYTEMAKIRMEIAKTSIHRAPMPKPICPAGNAIVTVSKQENGDDDFFSSPLSKELYVSRAGRQVKRKIYTEEMDPSDFDFGFPEKKNKSNEFDLKITVDNPYVSEEKSTKPVKAKKEMKRPSLNVKKLSRNEEMFSALIQNDQKKKQEEQKLDKFERSLEGEPDTLESPNLEQESRRRRVVPPKRFGQTRRSTKQDDLDKIEVAARSPSPVLKRRLGASAFVFASPRSQNKKPEALNVKYATCPICAQTFPQTTIENHAATCGIEEAEGTNEPPPKTKCDLCEKMFSSADYSTHMKQCVASKVTDL